MKISIKPPSRKTIDAGCQKIILESENEIDRMVLGGVADELMDSGKMSVIRNFREKIKERFAAAGFTWPEKWDHA